MSTALTTLTQKLATTLNMGNGAELVETLKATAFKGNVSDSQMTALLIVANQYGLNPWTKEIYAFPDKNNGIVPVVGVDGWSRIINSHSQFDGMDFEQDSESCTCIIWRKDRQHPIKITEYMSECKRANVGPWQSHPRRMLRHKAMIQCARLAFGYVGIYDADEAERIIESSGEKDMGPAVQTRSAPAALTDYPDADVAKNLTMWQDVIESGKGTPERIIAMIQTKYRLSDAQRAQIMALGDDTAAESENRALDAQIMEREAA